MRWRRLREMLAELATQSECGSARVRPVALALPEIPESFLKQRFFPVDRLCTLNTTDVHKPSDSHPEMRKPREARKHIDTQRVAPRAPKRSQQPRLPQSPANRNIPISPRNSRQPGGALFFHGEDAHLSKKPLKKRGIPLPSFEPTSFGLGSVGSRALGNRIRRSSPG